MSKGKPVIGATPGGHTDMIVDGETGLLVPSGDVDALTEALRTLLDDSELRERMGSAARERSALFDRDVILPRIEALYSGLVEAAGPRPPETPAVAAAGSSAFD
jgi:glycosyltransferase involved in cell wall biosynthesis